MLVCWCLAGAAEVKQAESDVEVSADQEAKELYGRRYYGYYGHPYYEYDGHYGHWRERRSVEEPKPEETANIDVTDQEMNEFYRGYYGGSRGYQRGRRSVEVVKPEQMGIEAGDDLNADEWYGLNYYVQPHGSYGRRGYWYGYFW